MSESLCSDTGMAHLLPHFLYAPGPRTSDIVECVKHFRAGRWQRLWNEGLKNAGKLRDKRARLTSRPQKRSDRAKDTYAQKCANKGNLRKAKNILTDDMTLAHGDETVDALTNVLDERAGHGTSQTPHKRVGRAC